MGEYLDKLKLSALAEYDAGKKIYFVPMSRINCMKSEDVAPVKHGKWIKKIKGHTYYYACSNCGAKTLQNEYHNDVFSDYCPRCGARMDLKD